MVGTSPRTNWVITVYRTLKWLRAQKKGGAAGGPVGALALPCNHT